LEIGLPVCPLARLPVCPAMAEFAGSGLLGFFTGYTLIKINNAIRACFELTHFPLLQTAIQRKTSNGQTG
jgi:hypothetical protein